MSRWRYRVPSYLDYNCKGCGHCESICKFGAVEVIDGKARWDESKCVSCMKCVINCPNEAILFEFLDEPKHIVFDYSDVDPVAINELCAKAHMDPERAVCMCTMTPAKEVAGAILKGARTIKDVALMTGVKTDCEIYCSAPVQTLLVAHLGDEFKRPNDPLWGYPTIPVLRNVSKETAEKYPEYFIKEDQELDKNLELPTIMELF